MNIEIVTGDNTIAQVQLNINDEALNVAPTGVSVILVSRDRKTKYMTLQEDQVVDSGWDTGLITVAIPGSATTGITYQGKAYLEVQATFSSSLDHTWWFPCDIKKGWVSTITS